MQKHNYYADVLKVTSALNWMIKRSVMVVENNNNLIHLIAVDLNLT